MRQLLLLFSSLLFVILSQSPLLAQHTTSYRGETYCAGCHAGGIGGNQVPGWSQTKHSWAYDSIPFVQNNSACLPCHTTGWDTTQRIGGFSDYYPPHTAADSTKIQNLKNVQCEDCHRPQSGPFPDTSMTAQKCGNCHIDEHLPTYPDWVLSKHARSDTTTLAGFGFIRSNPNCAGCHTAQGFLQWVADTVNLSPNVTAPGTSALPLTCAGCHDPHSHKNDHQLRLSKVQLCEKCHNPEYDPDSTNPGPTTEVNHSTAFMFEGKGGYQYPGWTYTNSAHTRVVTDKCVTCHVHQTPFEAGPPVKPAYTGHTFTPRIEACQQCHSGLNTFNKDSVQTQIDSLSGELLARLQIASHGDSTSQAFYRAKFNYEFVQADGSHGVHNTNYARQLLLSSIANFSPTAVQIVDKKIPVTYRLAQNYPNPFNPTTFIGVEIPRAGYVRLTIYDVTGSLVATLMDGSYEPGKYQVTWTGTDSRGAQVATGVYLYKIEAGSFIETRKMIYLK